MRQLFVSFLKKTNDSQVTLMVTAGTILSKRQELFENMLAESLKGHLAKLAEGLPVRFRHIVGHDVLAV
jgi:hypothetical protein